MDNTKSKGAAEKARKKEGSTNGKQLNVCAFLSKTSVRFESQMQN